MTACQCQMDAIHVSQVDGLQQVFGIDKQSLNHPHDDTLDRVMWAIQIRFKKTQTGVSQQLLGQLGNMEDCLAQTSTATTSI